MSLHHQKDSMMKKSPTTRVSLGFNSTAVISTANVGGGMKGLDAKTTEAIQIATAVILAVIMFGLGCSVKLKPVWMYCKRPKQFMAGLALQLIVMPILGLALTSILKTTPAESVGVLIQASCPGGVYSNIATYWLDGDIDLSIVMTTSSTVLALGTMPLWLYVLPKLARIDDKLMVPFDELGYSLLGIIVPVVAGSIMKLKFPKISDNVTKICSAVGSTAIVAMVIVLSVSKDVRYDISWRLIVIVLLFPATALVLGYLATLPPWLKFSMASRRTIAIETAMQSSAVGTTIVIRSFDISSLYFEEILLFPAMYGVLQLLAAFTAVIVYLILKKRGVSCVLATSGDNTENSSCGENRDALTNFNNEEKRETAAPLRLL